MHFGQILDACPSPPGHDKDDFMDWEDLVDVFTTFYASTDNQLELKVHMVGPLIIAYVMEAFKKFIRPLSRKNKKSDKQNDMADFKARHSGLSGLQGIRHARAKNASHPELTTEKSFSRAFSTMERLFEVNSGTKGKYASRVHVTGSPRESNQDSDADGDFLPDLDDHLSGMESDSDPVEKAFCSSQPLGKSKPQSLGNDNNDALSTDNKPLMADRAVVDDCNNNTKAPLPETAGKILSLESEAISITSADVIPNV